jgi:putative transposase
MLELYSRRVLGWAMAELMTTVLVCDALEMALLRQKLSKDIIVHSKRGSQNLSKAFRRTSADLQHEQEKRLLRQCRDV